MEDLAYPTYFDVHDSRLAFLASVVSIQIDTKHAGEEERVDYTPVYKLASYLAGVVSDKKRTPPTTVVLTNVMKKHSDREIDSVDNLMLKVSLAAQELYSVQSLPKERLAALRTFCVDLSKEAGSWAMQYGKRRRLVA